VLGLLVFGVVRRGRAGEPTPPAAPARPPPAGSRSEPRTTPRERMGVSSLWSSGPSPEPRRAPVSMIEQPDPAPEETPGFCTDCGRRLAPDHRFCGFCGHKAR
jgi:hypothetical protein